MSRLKRSHYTLYTNASRIRLPRPPRQKTTPTPRTELAIVRKGQDAILFGDCNVSIRSTLRLQDGRSTGIGNVYRDSVGRAFGSYHQ